MNVLTFSAASTWINSHRSAVTAEGESVVARTAADVVSAAVTTSGKSWSVTSSGAVVVESASSRDTGASVDTEVDTRGERVVKVVVEGLAVVVDGSGTP